MALTDNLVSYWKLEEGTGTRDDAHGSNDLTGTTQGAVTGKINNGEDFERASSNYLSITDASQTGLDIGASSFSMNIWANFESLPSTAANYFGFIGKFSSTGGNRSYYFVMLDSDKIEVSMSQDGANVTRRISQSNSVQITTGELGTWHMYTAVFDMSTTTWTVYKDASSLALTTNNAGTPTTVYNNALPFTVGWGNQAGAQYFDGILDEVGIWNKALTGAEITELYNAGAGLAYPFTSTANTAGFFAFF